MFNLTSKTAKMLHCIFLFSMLIAGDALFAQSKVECSANKTARACKGGPDAIILTFKNFDSENRYEIDLANPLVSGDRSNFDVGTATQAAGLSAYNSNPGWRYTHTVGFSAGGSTGRKSAVITYNIYNVEGGSRTSLYTRLQVVVEGDVIGELKLQNARPYEKDFGSVEVGESVSKTLYFENSGESEISDFNAYISGPGDGSENAFAFSMSYDPILTGERREVKIEFSPDEAKKYEYCYFTIKYRSCNGKTWEYAGAQLSGTGASDPSSISGYEKNAIGIYPNPVTERMIFVSEVPFSSVQIINSMGVNVKSLNGIFEAGEKAIDVSGLTPGCYFIKVSTNDGIVTIPFIRK